ncbi:MAG TPA: hypothetical protein DEH78_06130, partial [Solibacterales bacterium]|nr:hypothetical protein [Bryobacterales bacterium]
MRLPILIALLAGAASAQFYPFNIDQDTLAGAPDFSFLNRPIEPQDRLFVRDGRFHRVGPDLTPNTGDDERVRLFGVNLAFDANFPEFRDAERIARRLRKLGVNLVRLHHMDSQPDSNAANARSLLTTGPYPALNPNSVERLRRFLDALKAEGIYVNLNLHVGYTFRPGADNIPALAPFPSQSKPLHMIHPRMIELQAEFTRKTIEALALRNDPVLGMVEINNESSIVHDWQTYGLDSVLVGEYRDVFAGGWNDYLRARYPSTEALQQAWAGAEPDGPDRLPNRWVIERGSPSDGTLTNEPDGSVRVVVTARGPRFILKQVGFSIPEGEPIVAEVDLRIDAPAGASGAVYWDLKQDVNPWRTMVAQNLTVTNQWRTYRIAVTPTWTMDGIARFGLQFEALAYPLLVRNARVYRAGRRGLADGETLETGVSLVGEGEIAVDTRLNDYLLYLADRDRHYLRQMLAAVRESADPLVPVAGTQMGYGGLLNIDSHDDLDYQDHHFYIDHYSFPNVQWDGRDWRIRDSSSVGTGLGAFLSMASARQAGRPYTVSEYNQPWPNTYAAEITPTLAAFGAFQDWDSIMHFAYAHSRNWDRGVPNGFNIDGDWTKFVNIGQAAWLFRTAAIAPSVEPMKIPLPLDARLRATRERRNGGIATFLSAALRVNPNTFLRHRVELVKDGDGEPPDAAREENPDPVSDTGELSYDSAGKLLRASSAKAVGIYGFAGRNKTVTAGPVDVELTGEARGFLALTLTPLDGAALADAPRLLLSNPGYTLR